MTSETDPREVLPAEGGDRLETDRRTFFRTLSIGAAASLAACQRLPVSQAIPHLVPPESITPGVPVRYASSCLACPAGCGLLVTNLDGRPVKLEGNPEHPVSKGGLCAVGQADLRALYDPARLAGPLVAGRPASWEELDRMVTGGLARAAAAGTGTWVLSGTLVSPTARRLVGQFASERGGKLVEWDADPESPSAQREAQVLLGMAPLAPSVRLEAVDRLVVLGADPLGSGAEPVAFTRAYADRKRAAAGRDFRHIQVEGVSSLSGAAADERWIATPAERRQLARALARRLAEEASGPEAEMVRATIPDGEKSGIPSERFERLVRELVSHRGAAVILSAGDDPGEQLAVALANRFLGAEGTTLDPARPSLVRRGTEAGLIELEAAMAAGRVGVLVILGLDPVDQLPSPALAAGLGSVPMVVAVTDRPTATAARAGAVAAAHHGLECWADVEVRPGLVTLAQPAIRPLFGSRHPFENFLVWSGAPSTDWRLHLVEEHRRRAGGFVGFDAAWTEAVSRGFAPGVDPVALPEASPAGEAPRLGDAAILLGATVPAVEGLVVEAVADVAMRDGSRSHVPWLRELPDPITRNSWMGTVRMAPSRADALSLQDGDLVTVGEGSGAVTMPMVRVPGMHPAVVAVPIGYGRHDGDPDGGARNGWRAVARDGSRFRLRGGAAKVAKAGGRHELALMQREGELHGRPLVHQVASPDEKVPAGHHGDGAHANLWPERPLGERKWEMVIDLDACTGCAGCVVACQAENNLPVVGEEEMRVNRDMYWLRIDRYFAGDPENPDVLFEPMLCSQCGNAPCETVCPVAATVHSDDGLNQQAYNRCVGTRYCANNCPYKVRRFNWFDHDFPTPIERLALNPNVVVRERGVMEKCTFCVQRIQLGRIEARVDGRATWQVETACSQSCPAKAIVFGDAADPASEVSKAKKNPRAFQVLGELGVRPAVTYLARVRNREGGAPSSTKGGHEA